METIPLSSLPGSDEVIRCYGEWPCFHDAEIVNLKLARKSVSWVTISLETSSGGEDDDEIEAIRFYLYDVLDLSLRDFSIQNVIGGVWIEPAEVGTKISFGYCFGLYGWIQARFIKVAVINHKSREASNGAPAIEAPPTNTPG